MAGGLAFNVTIRAKLQEMRKTRVIRGKFYTKISITTFIISMVKPSEPGAKPFDECWQIKS